VQKEIAPHRKRRLTNPWLSMHRVFVLVQGAREQVETGAGAKRPSRPSHQAAMQNRPVCVGQSPVAHHRRWWPEQLSAVPLR
jgi:hypothetical protein